MQTDTLGTLSISNDFTLTLRKATKEDATDIGQLLRTCSDWLCSKGMTHWDGYHTDARCLNEIQSSMVVCAHEGENLIATFTLADKVPDYAIGVFDKHWKDNSATFRFLKKLAVLPEKQGCGIGHALTAKAIEFAKDLGVSFLRLDLNPNAKSLGEFYSQHGFVYRADTEAGIIYEKTLEDT